MAGTPTTNYNFPTIADGDIIDGVSAINGLAVAVDTALKSVADSGVTAGTGITLSGGQVSVDTAWLTSQINAALTAKKATTWGKLKTDGFVSGSAE